MRDTISFSTFDPLFSDAPSLCDVCESKPSIFEFESHGSGDGTRRRKKGFCCASCAAVLLAELQREESVAWAEEEASMRSDGLDMTDFHTRRLATFGNGKN